MHEDIIDKFIKVSKKTIAFVVDLVCSSASKITCSLNKHIDSYHLGMFDQYLKIISSRTNKWKERNK